jgi:4-hydroxybenzoate polyprenyltransferase
VAAAVLKLIRWPNLAIIALIFLLLRFGLVDGFMAVSILTPCLTDLQWLVMALATVLIAASGNVVNDIFDINIDRINRPDDRVVGVTVGEEHAWNLYYVLSGLGLALGIYLAWSLGNISNALVFMLAIGGLWFYSYSYKRQFLIGNLVVSLLAAITVGLPLFFEAVCSPNDWERQPWAPFVLAYALFAFLSTLVREIIKDMEDMEGDADMGCRTLPIVVGVKGGKAVAALLTMVIMATVARYQWARWESNDTLSFLWLLAGVQAPAVMVLNSLLKATDRSGFHRASTLAKVMMVGGITSMILFRFTLE